MSQTDTSPRNFSNIDPARGFPAIAKAKPDIYRNFFAMADAIMRGKGALTDAQREVVGAYVSKISDCSFCHDSHVALAEALGEADAAMLVDEPSGEMKPLLDLAQKVVRHERPITREDIDMVIDAGWSEEAAEEVIHVTAFFGFANRIVTGYGFVGTPESFAQMAKHLSKSYQF